MNNHNLNLSPSDARSSDLLSQDASNRWLLGRRSFLFASCLAIGGCKSLISRGQDAALTPEEVVDDGIQYISAVTNVWGAAPAKIEGVGMVAELAGTGSAPAPSAYREELTDDLRARKVEKINQLLSEDKTSLVILAGLLPAGARKGQSFDVFVSVPKGSETTSLESGILMPARLMPKQTLGRVRRSGRFAARAGGGVLVDSLFYDGEKGQKTSGLVPGGGTMVRDRPFGLALRSDARSIRKAVVVTKAINQRFNYYDNAKRQPVAKAKNDHEIYLEVPAIYHDNVYRYLHVLRNIVVEESIKERTNRTEALEPMLMDPKTAEVAALRLEAIGRDSLAMLQRGLGHSSATVRFASAMAITYQGDASACETLGHLAIGNPEYRWHSLNALSSLPEVEAKRQLVKLLQTEEIPVRYGAVRSLNTRGQGESEVVTERFGDNGDRFTMKSVFSAVKPAIHLSRAKSPEIVVFNTNQRFRPGTLLVGKGWTVRSKDGGIEIVRYRSVGDKVTRCSSMVTEVIRNLGDMGADYTSIVKFFTQASADNSLEGDLALNSLNAVTSVQENMEQANQKPPALFQDESQALADLDANQIDRQEAMDKTMVPKPEPPSWSQSLFGTGTQ